MKHIGGALLLLLVGCASVQSTQEIPAVKGFVASNFAGEWYEIARLPNAFEENLMDVKYVYQAKDGEMDVARIGFCDDRERTLPMIGEYVGESDIGEIRLRYLSGFRQLQRIVWLSKDYDQAIITGLDSSFLWILVRDKKIPQAEIDKLVKRAQDLGFDTAKLEYPQSKK